MTPKKKAIELVDKFECYVDYQGDDCFTEREKMLINAKQCALIAVDEIFEETRDYCEDNYHQDRMNYWQEVKQEIENL